LLSDEQNTVDWALRELVSIGKITPDQRQKKLLDLFNGTFVYAIDYEEASLVVALDCREGGSRKPYCEFDVDRKLEFMR